MDVAVVAVEAGPTDGGALRVRWETTEPVAVDLALGATPVPSEHRHLRTEPAGTTEAVIEPAPAGPTFVSVAPHGAGLAVVAGERRVRFVGLANFRDLGGYRAAGGGRTRWGRLFRADSLHKLAGPDRAAFDRLGVRSVVDLRGEREHEEHPNPFGHAVRLPVRGRPSLTGQDAPDRPVPDGRATDGGQVLRDLYVGMLEHSPRYFHEFFATLLRPDGLPAVFHCHAGKDRTGVVAALTLLAVGVSHDDVLDDYELTHRFWHAGNQTEAYERLLSRGMAPEVAAGLLGAPRWAMADTLETLDGTYGGIERYLTGTVGLSGGQLDRLRDVLVG